jgi:hypothetical protein
MRVGSEPRLPSEIGDPLVSDGGGRGDTAPRATASAAQRGQAPGREIDRRDLDLDSARIAPAHSKGCLLEPGRLFDQLAMEEDSQTARATDAPRISTVATYRAYNSNPQTMSSTASLAPFRTRRPIAGCPYLPFRRRPFRRSTIVLPLSPGCRKADFTFVNSSTRVNGLARNGTFKSLSPCRARISAGCADM